MTRIGPRPGTAHATRITPRRTGSASNAQHAGTHVAVVYRGTTVFGYATAPSSAQAKAPSARARRLTALLGRKRTAQRHSRHGIDDDDTDDVGESGSAHTEHARVTRHGDNGSGSGAGTGGGNGGERQRDGESQRGRAHAHAREPIAVKARARGAAPPLEPGPLQSLATVNMDHASPSVDTHALRCEKLLALRDELYRDPHAAIDVRLYELAIDVLAYKLSVGPDEAQRHWPSADNLTAQVRERLVAASRNRSAPKHPDGETSVPFAAAILSRAASDEAPVPRTDRTSLEQVPDRARVARLNLLLPLIQINDHRPSTPTQIERALRTLASLRAARWQRSVTTSGSVGPAA
jgi:type III secretion regulatory protein HpaA